MTDRLLRLATIAAAIGLGARGLADPSSVLAGGIAWLGFLLFVVSGWGYLVVKIARVEDPDLGMRALWGLAGYLAVSGPLLAAGVLSRPVILAMIGLGALAAAWREWTTDEPLWQRVLDGVAALRQRPGASLFVVLILGVVVLQITGAIATLDRNPWDDDIAYTPLVKRLLDAGNLIEPFSFRRLGAYGGQTLLDALAGARGSLASVHLIDKGLCYAIALLLLAGYARTLRTQPLWTAVVALVVVLMPDTAINTASYWSGVAVFVGLYRCVVDERWALAGLVGAAACTLRQNYIEIAVVFLGLALGARLLRAARASSWRAGWIAERKAWLWCAGIAALVLVPYWIAAYRSNGTFLFPFLEGTWNPSVSLRATAPTWTDELQFGVWCLIETHPIVVIPSVFAVMVFATDARPTRPITALLVASTLGLVLMVHSFVGSDTNHLWRYAFAAALTLLAVFSLEIGADESNTRLVPLGRWVLLASLLLQLAVQREALPKRFATLFGNLREARVLERSGDPSAQAQQRRYTALQAAIPAGESVAVMLDDPQYLDFARNRIFNLDTPGYASPRPGMPSFAGPDAVRAYLRGQGIRYVAFVRSDRSRYFYRRPFWIWRIFNDAEIFQTMSAYAIDAIETFAALSTKVTVLHEEDGLVVLDLGAEVPTVAAPSGSEAVRRAAFVRALADREGLHDAWSLNNRADLLFDDGFTGLAFLDGSADDPVWYDVLHPPATAPTRGVAARWLYRRAHLRVHGERDMRLALRGKINVGVAYTRPRLDVMLDGELLATVIADPTGAFAITADVAAAQLAGGWHDVYLVFDSIAEPQKEVRELRAARIESVEWEPR
ncbi:MAG: hypothetical protein IPQ07_40855 [Myxococcales bacterium]|nr:hypothetical protein [Myxococcales bacterium]